MCGRHMVIKDRQMQRAHLLSNAFITIEEALKYVDSSDTWMDALVVAREAGVDYRSMLAGFKVPSFNRDPFVEIPDENGNLHVIYVVELVSEGKTAPLEYCAERIRDLILSARKHALFSIMPGLVHQRRSIRGGSISGFSPNLST